MATRGVKQLQTLRIAYCNYGGSSESVRAFISSGKIVDFAKQNPSVEVIGELRNGKHPYIRAEYLTGFDKQVCVKNESLGRILEVIHMLNNSSGRKIKQIEGSTQTDKPSIQGVWTPMLDIVQKNFKIEICLAITWGTVHKQVPIAHHAVAILNKWIIDPLKSEPLPLNKDNLFAVLNGQVDKVYLLTDKLK